MRRLKEFITGLSLVVVIGCITFFAVTIANNMNKPEEVREEPREEPEPITIIEPEPCKYGMIRVYEGQDVIFEFAGDINIKNDGTNGEMILITGMTLE